MQYFRSILEYILLLNRITTNLTFERMAFYTTLKTNLNKRERKTFQQNKCLFMTDISINSFIHTQIESKEYKVLPIIFFNGILSTNNPHLLGNKLSSARFISAHIIGMPSSYLL